MSQDQDGRGCLLELQPESGAVLADGTRRTRLEPGDGVMLTGFCQNEAGSLCFGECTGFLSLDTAKK